MTRLSAPKSHIDDDVLSNLLEISCLHDDISLILHYWDRNFNKHMLMYTAIYSESVKIIRFLIDSGVHLSEGHLIAATQLGNEEIFEMCTCATPAMDWEYIFQIATYSNVPNIVSLILSKGLLPLHIQQWAETYAFGNGVIEIARVLLLHTTNASFCKMCAELYKQTALLKTLFP